MVVGIVGMGGSGKDEAVNRFIKNNPDWEKIIGYTTRPIRQGEEDGVDYHFISVDDFNNKKNFTYAEVFNGWGYGTVIEPDDLTNDTKKLLIITPTAVRYLEKTGVHIPVIYIMVNRIDALNNMLSRGDNIDEAYRRNLQDYGMFMGFNNECSAVIDNRGIKMTPSGVADAIGTAIQRLSEAVKNNGEGVDDKN